MWPIKMIDPRVPQFTHLAWILAGGRLASFRYSLRCLYEVDTAADNNMPKGWLFTLGTDTRTLAAADFGYADLLTATAKGSPRNPRQ